ncbi:kinase-like domain-containing protein [Mycena leptocephala]|nr:kinase-like domain-containing protein [Mycena leptocephala]
MLTKYIPQIFVPKPGPGRLSFDLANGHKYKPAEEPLYLDSLSGYGHMDIKIGMIISHYEVVRKLGWARYSSVWLCRYVVDPNHFLSILTRMCRRDTSDPAQPYVALQVLTRYGSACLEAKASFEYEVFHRVRSTNPLHPGFPHCIGLLKPGFEPTGGHVLFAMEPLGSDLERLRRSQPKRKFSMQIARRIVKQMLLALDYLHNECAFIHADLKPDNFLVCPPDLTQEHIKDFLSRSPIKRHHPISEPSLAPHPIVTIQSQPLPNSGLAPSLENLHIKLIDYGQAIPVNSPVDPDQNLQFHLVRAPEVILRSVWSPAMDIWSVGCLLFTFLTDAHIFTQNTRPFSPALHLQKMEEVFGPFPPSFLARCPQSTEYLDENGKLRCPRTFIPCRLENLLPKFKSADESVIPFIRRCLTLDPHARPSAKELLNDPWLKGA